MTSHVNVFEPRVRVTAEQEAAHVVRRGGKIVTSFTQVADSFQTVPTNSLFTVYSPSPETIIDRNVRVKSYWRVTSQSGDFEIGLNDAVRQFPFSSTVATTSTTINGETITDNTADKLHALWCYGNSAQERGTKLSAAAAQPDAYLEYRDYTTEGLARHPLARYGENDSEQTRGGIEYTVVSPTVIEFSTTEPLQLSPFLTGLHEDEGMANVDRINVAFRHKADLARVWSHATTGQAISGLTVEFTRAPELLVNFITPDSIEEIPRVQKLSYHKCQDYVQRTELVTAQASSQVVNNSLKLTQVPHKLYLFLKRDRSSETFETTDTFARINRVSILWNNESALLSGAQPEELYKMSVENGLNVSYPAFRQYRGSVVCVDFGKDIGLPASQAPGSQGVYSMQVTVSFTNQSQEDITYESWMIVNYAGTFDISEHQARASLGGLTQEEVLATQNHPEIPKELAGGSFWSSLKSVVKKAAPLVGQAAQIGSAVAGAVGHPEIAAGLGTVGQLAGSGLKTGGSMGRRRVR